MSEPHPLDRAKLTRFLNELRRGDADGDSTVLPHVYRELRSIAGALVRRDRGPRGLEPTELVNEAFMRLVDPEGLDLAHRRHFFALAARAMRQILVDDARARGRLKRGGDAGQVLLDESVALAAGADVEVLDLDEALVQLAALSERQARVVEMRFFAGLAMGEIAGALGVSKPTVERDWVAARAWLGRRLGMGAG